ncbi:hypothetical protein F5Y18DRAFT_209015 [Xylariaceae sp. FL1019]|nr:hypothetical protein F5Y18DRAFT_209015 [Xylariaceae sp. FL1019]
MCHNLCPHFQIIACFLGDSCGTDFLPRMPMLSTMSSSQESNFLRLMIEVRSFIYHDAGLIRGRCIPIAPTSYQASERRWPLSSVPGMTHSLLQVCKQVKQEVGMLICQHNTMALVEEEIDYGLAFLRSLSPQQCAALKSLSISLYQRKRKWRPEEPADSLHPSWASNPQPLLDSWLSAARHVLSNTQQTLAVQLFCHTGYNAITNAILQPFLEYPGHLKELELELDYKKGAKHFELRTLAWQTVCCAKGADTGLSFRLFDLPAEIRHHILSYTDLVSPSNEIYWNARQGFKVLRLFDDCWSPHSEALIGTCNETSHQECRFFSCENSVSPATGLKCCESQVNIDHRWDCDGRCHWTGFVCCRSWTGYSSRCRCWSNPRSLLIANRQLYREAIRVLYSYNRVIVVPSEDFRVPIGPINKRLDIATFITRHMWPETLNHLRDLECVFPCIDPSSPSLAHDTYTLDLCFAIDHLATYACMSQLHVSVNLTTASSVRQDDMRWFHRELKMHGVVTAVRSHSQLLSAFRSLKGAKDFFVKLEYGWHVYDNRPDERGHGTWSTLYAEIDFLERSLERMIMGEEYTSGLEKKLHRKPAIWPWRIGIQLEYSDWSGQLSNPRVGYILW